MYLKVRTLNNEKRICRQCEAQFVPTVGNQIFCSTECRNIWYGLNPLRYYSIRPSEVKHCLQCYKEFLTNKKRKTYCSPECQIIHREATYIPNQFVKRVCTNQSCGIEFETTHAHKKFCSEECRIIAHRSLHD